MDEDKKIVWASGDDKPLAPAGRIRRLSRKTKPGRQATSKATRFPARGLDSTRKSRRASTRSSSSQQLHTLNDADEASELVDEDEDELPDEALPDYIKMRRASFENARNSLGRVGLKLPPLYDDMEFSEDEQPSNLARKPVFPKSIPIVPRAPFKDITLDRSGGVIPAPIAQWLRDYQIDGVRFLHERFVYQRGAILGDAMGLGKTIQVIAFLTAAFGKTGDERDHKRMRKMRRMREDQWYPRILIICPGSLMLNWLSELKCWGWWQAELYHGKTSHRQAVLQAATSGHVEIMITTYTTYKLNMQAINTVEWDCVVADECHFIKERKSEISKAMNNVNALCRIGLTGTPMQNTYEDLWTLFNWTNPGKLGALSTWKKCISDPLRIGQAHRCVVRSSFLAKY
jgi:SNF2 family DNA or RNA helicase